jgi:hypothetical protein
LVKFGRRSVCIAVTCTFGVAVIGPQAAFAAVDFSTTAGAGIQYNSNVFDLASGQPQPLGRSSGEDRIEDYTAGLSGIFRRSADDAIEVTATGKHYEYQNFSYLSHNEYNGNARVTWRFGPVISVLLTGDYVRAMAPFANTFSTVLILDTLKTASATVRVLVTPEWALDLTPRVNDLLTPLPSYQEFPAYPDFSLHEKEGTVAVNYLGVAHTTFGTAVSYTDGEYEHIVGATRYHQVTAALTATYKVSNMSSFKGAFGYTVRNTVANPAGALPPPPETTQQNPFFQGQVGKSGYVTGMVSYTRQLSPKTMVGADIYRDVVSYTGGANTVIESGVKANATWKPDFRFIVTVNAGIERDRYPGTITTLGVTDRVDNVYTGEALVVYQAMRWLSCTANLKYNTRTSNFNLAGYSGLIAGIEVTARIPPPKE